MKCQTCGTNNPENARFCGNCRQSFVEESSKERRTGGSKIKWVWISLAALVLLAFIGMVIQINNNAGDTSAPSSPEGIFGVLAQPTNTPTPAFMPKPRLIPTPTVMPSPKLIATPTVIPTVMPSPKLIAAPTATPAVVLTAIDYFQKEVENSRKVKEINADETGGLADAFSRLGRVYFEIGDLKQAERFCKQVLILATEFQLKSFATIPSVSPASSRGYLSRRGSRQVETTQSRRAHPRSPGMLITRTLALLLSSKTSAGCRQPGPSATSWQCCSTARTWPK